jgi:hypothetical protein
MCFLVNSQTIDRTSVDEAVAVVQSQGLAPRFVLPRRIVDKAEPLTEEGRAMIATLHMPLDYAATRLKNGESLELSSLPESMRLTLEHDANLKFSFLLFSTWQALEKGTGDLQDDLAILEQGPESVAPEKWACVLYRAGQKRIIKEHLNSTLDVLREAGAKPL